MDPAALFPGLREDLAHRGPEAEPAVARGELGIDREPPVLDIQQELTPRLLALAVAIGDGDELFLPVSGGAHQHQNALAFVVRVLEPHVEVHAVRPDVDIAAIGQRPLRPCRILLFPDGLQARDRGRG